MIRNVGINSTRIGILHILQRMGASIECHHKRLFGEELVADLRIKHAPLKGIDIPVTMVPSAIDEFPIIFIAASLARGRTTLHGASELRVKESDRIQAMVDGLTHLGINAVGLPDGISIEGGTLVGGTVNSYHDHRIAMAFAIAGCIAKGPVTILNCNQVETSFPTFIELAQQLGLSIHHLKDSNEGK